MSFLRRLAGPGHGARFNVTCFTRIRDDASLPIVGEYYRQNQVLRARPPGPNDLPPGMPPPPPGYYKALVTPEPTNRFDKNALLVLLWAGGSWAHSGYLSREDAVRYQPLFWHLIRSGTGSSPAVACDAALVPERDAVGVVLHLGTPGECAVDLAIEGRLPANHPWMGRTLVFSGQGVTTIYGVPLDREAQVMLARWAGCEVLPRLTKKTGLLVLADPNEVTGNPQKAREYAVPVEPEPAFVASVGIPPEMIGQGAQRWAHP
jgi:hypothetical protein